MIPQPGAEVWGRLWRVRNEELAKMDRIEAAYDRHEVTVDRLGHHKGGRAELITAVTYMVKQARRSAEGTPSPAYLQCLLKGAAECDLPDGYVTCLRAISAPSD